MRLPRFVYFIASLLYTSSVFAVDVPREMFPIEAYSQDANYFISPESATYEENLLTPAYQEARLKQFYLHYYQSDEAGLSPWSEALVGSVLPHLKTAEQGILNGFSGTDHYAENFRPHDKNWWPKLKANANLDSLNQATYEAKNRAIVTRNTAARALPDAAPDFFDAKIAGEGFPFDNLQVASLWVGTPIYVFTTSVDKAWSLVLTPDAYFAWVKSDDIAYASESFISTWQKAAQNKLAAMTETEVSILDTQKRFQFSAYIGAVFPMVSRNTENTSILIPVQNHAHEAEIKTGILSSNSIQPMPFTATPKHISAVIQQLQHRAYGWGGAFFLNDCSQEMKSLFTPFGIWLPRNSGMQQQLNPTIDLSQHTKEERLALLKTKGHPLMTLIYKKGHILLYVGKAEVNHQLEAISYQNVWGLSSKDKNMRYVIGGSVFLPLLADYPEQNAVSVQADDTVFKLVQLDVAPSSEPSPEQFAEMFS